jgi:hypothetical protein
VVFTDWGSLALQWSADGKTAIVSTSRSRYTVDATSGEVQARLSPSLVPTPAG